MSIIPQTLGIVLAGSVGSRLSPLTQDRAKPAVPFGGQYRIIDFTLSNCLHSGLRQILVLTQYKSQSLHRHLNDAWSMLTPALGEYITAVPPQLRTGDSWYRGTADAIYQNLCMVRSSGTQYVMILSGDHIYRMDYSELLQDHRCSGADVTVACMETDLDQARSFGVVSTDADGRIRRFDEKPARPQPVPGNPRRSLVSMGIYAFSTRALCRELDRDSLDPASSHDFGRDLLPRMVRTHRVHGWRFTSSDRCTALTDYWRDVGTIDAFYEANMDVLRPQPPLDLHSRCWPIHERRPSAPPARVRPDPSGHPGSVSDSLLSCGVMVCGGSVEHSILSPDVRIGSGAVVENSILFDGVQVGEGAQLSGCIVDKDVCIPAGEVIGGQPFRDADRFTVSDDGIVVVPRGYHFTGSGQRPLVREFL